MELKSMSDKEMDEMFTVAQAQITELQAMQMEIDKERRMRRASDLIEAKRLELTALEKELS